VIAKRYSTFTPVRARRFRPMLQLRLRTSADRVLVLEFRPRDRALARKVVREVGVPDTGRGRKRRGGARAVTDEQDLAELLKP